MLLAAQFPTIMKYAQMRFPGALNRAWLQSEVHRRLHRANEIVERESGGKASILIWDALRSFTTQKYLFDVEKKKLKALNPSWDEDKLHTTLCEYVRPPVLDPPPPHTTGGAVDVTLWCDDNDLSLGQFDDFTPRGYPDFFQINPPKTQIEIDAASRRNLLRRAMLESGFVGIPSEWWHYEFGTRYWAQTLGGQPIFDEVVHAPVNDSFAARLPHLPARQVVDIHGVAQAFGSPSERSDALRGVSKSYYYARTRHHNEQQVKELLCSIVGAPDAMIMPSGLCAATVAVSCMMPINGTLVVDKTAYYECRTSLRSLAKSRRWNYLELDLSDDRDLKQLANLTFNLVFCDHPRNWLLTTPKLKFIKVLCADKGAKLVVDTSVQPLQRLFEYQLADVTVMSLSKYPSCGETIAGAILGSADMLQSIREWSKIRGIVVAPETSATLLSYLPTLRDRLSAISEKALVVKGFLSGNRNVKNAKLPDLSDIGALCGGQLCFEVASIEAGRRVEEAVGWNTSRRDFPLALACTFGAAFTTFEHFDSRNVDGVATSENSDYINNCTIRLGLGHENVSDIVLALSFVLCQASNDS
jgi:zinc D-Ala-D-Ala dipeptidase